MTETTQIQMQLDENGAGWVTIDAPISSLTAAVVVDGEKGTATFAVDATDPTVTCVSVVNGDPNATATVNLTLAEAPPAQTSNVEQSSSGDAATTFDGQDHDPPDPTPPVVSAGQIDDISVTTRQTVDYPGPDDLRGSVVHEVDGDDSTVCPICAHRFVPGEPRP